MSIDVGFLLEALIKIVVVFHIVLIILAYTVYAERRVLAVIQNRLGPNRVGPQGLLQPFADLLKFIFKEELVPLAANKWLYLLAPLVALVPAFMTMIVYPFGGTVNLPWVGEIDLVVTHFNVGLLYVFAMTSLGVYGIVIAGWASNSKYSLLGGLRSSAQMVSYELALSLSVIGALLQAGSLDLVEIVRAQGGFFGLGWHIFWFQPLGFFIFLISAIAETNRIPFDLPEAETELVAGFHTEYSAMKFALFFLGEYANMLTASVLATVLFLGGWQGPFVDQFPLLGPVYFLGKVFFFIFLYIWLRGTLPRFRYDQLMNFGWKFLLPAALFNIVLSAIVALFAL
ncbi:MAG: NADH-quinone oxidoreductase subunit NuoH [Acidobacteria bacterium]|nr:NADH-quinone oxidoreductase subunit NuoH [Acidobacteriota bacterium]MCW5967127.1 NADH-quinone oxidoreductase subunit NuoH [Blastocatellales bacterium]